MFEQLMAVGFCVFFSCIGIATVTAVVNDHAEEMACIQRTGHGCK